jgi:hypothetical protein
MGMSLKDHQLLSIFSKAIDGLKKSFTASTDTVAGLFGMVPAPPIGSQEKFLLGNATWKHESFRGVHSATKDYAVGNTCIANGVLVICNADVPKTAPFLWGSTGATWAPAVDSALLFQGIYDPAVSYSSKSIVAISNSQGLLYRSLANNNLGKGITDITAWVPFSPTLDMSNLVNVPGGTSASTSTPGTVLSKMLIETVQVLSNAIAGSPQLSFELSSGLVILHTVAPGSNWSVNVTASTSTLLNATLAIGQAVTFTHLIQMGTTPYMPTAVSVDGQIKTEMWSAGLKPSAGIANALNCYSYTILKTADASFLVLCDQSVFK